MDYKKAARDIVKNVGGEQNISDVTHCFTRLRFVLKDRKLADKDVPLEESFAIYTEGTKLLKYCSSRLDKVEKKMLVLDEEGETHEFETAGKAKHYLISKWLSVAQHSTNHR